jgi:protein-disulfide isomerase
LHDADVVGVSFDPGERAYGVGIRTSGEGMSACGDEIEALAANARDVYPGCRHAARYEPEAEFAVQAKFEMIEGRSQLSAVAVASAQTPESEQLARCLVDSLLGEEGHEYTPGFTGVLEFRFWPLEPDEYDAAAIVNRVRSEGRLEIDGANLPRRGSADVTPSVIPSVTMVECVDLECPFTRKAAPVVDQVLDVYGDRIAYAVLQNPLAMHEGATLKALAMVAAHQQGRFWEVFDYFHTHIMPMGDEEMHAMAQGLGLDADRFMTALHDPATVKEVERQQQICLSNNGKGTPTFFINGLRLPGAQDFEIFRRLIDDELGGDDHPNGRSISN